VLRAIGDVVGAAVRRSGDVGARVGGEEFTVILPNTPSDGAVEIAEAIRQAVADHRIPHERNAAGVVTISIGVATVIPPRDTPAASLFEKADQALYAAKAMGRNQTSCFEPAEGCES